MVDLTCQSRVGDRSVIGAGPPVAVRGSRARDNKLRTGRLGDRPVPQNGAEVDCGVVEVISLQEILGRAELDPGTLPRELTNYYNLKYEYEHGLSEINPDELSDQELAITTNSIVSWNYQAIYDLIQEIEDLKKENEELGQRIEALENE